MPRAFGRRRIFRGRERLSFIGGRARRGAAGAERSKRIVDHGQEPPRPRFEPPRFQKRDKNRLELLSNNRT